MKNFQNTLVESLLAKHVFILTNAC